MKAGSCSHRNFACGTNLHLLVMPCCSNFNDYTRHCNQIAYRRSINFGNHTNLKIAILIHIWWVVALHFTISKAKASWCRNNMRVRCYQLPTAHLNLLRFCLWHAMKPEISERWSFPIACHHSAIALQVNTCLFVNARITYKDFHQHTSPFKMQSTTEDALRGEVAQVFVHRVLRMCLYCGKAWSDFQ